jgi:hypothetical protein
VSGKPTSLTVRPVDMVHLLALHPELRDSFPLADAVDMAIRAGA